MEGFGISRLTNLGKQTLAIFCTSIAVGLVLRDNVLLIIGTLILGIMSYSYLSTNIRVNSIKDQIKIVNNKINASIIAGEKHTTSIIIESESNSQLSIISGTQITISPTSIMKGINEHEVNITYELAGHYQENKIKIIINDIIGLYEGEAWLDLDTDVTVYPQFFPIALKAADFLIQSTENIGDQYSTQRGNGLEYADTRQYIAGDSINRIDWKATARLTKLMVKDYYRDAGVENQIIFDGSAPDPVSKDELIKAFLEAVLSYSEAKWNIGLTILKDEKVLFHNTNLHSINAVRYALEYSLKGFESKFQKYIQIIEPKKTNQLSTFLKNIKFDNRNRRQTITQYLNDLLTLYTKGNTILHITSLMNNSSLPYEIQYRSNIKQWRYCILNPTKPWLWYENLENSMKTHNHLNKTYDTLYRNSIKVVTNIEETNNYFIQYPRVFA